MIKQVWGPLPSRALVLSVSSVTSVGMAWELVRNNESDVHFKISRWFTCTLGLRGAALEP